MSADEDLEALRRQWAELLARDPGGARLSYVKSASMEIAVDGDGALLVRERGGPIFHMGRLSSFEKATLPAWRASIAPERHRALVAGLVDARFPIGDENAMPVPDELPSYVTVEHRSGERATMSAYHRALQADLALHCIVAELDGLSQALKVGPPTERMANPERDEWATVKNRAPFALDETGPEPPADAKARAKQAVERFYAEQFEARIRQVASLHGPRTKRTEPARHDAPRPANVTCTFTCRNTRQPAGTVSFRGEPSGGVLALAGFRPTGNVERRVTYFEGEAARAALVASDAQPLWKLDPEIVPFYCPTCGASYAADQWKLQEPSASRLDGTCPWGHARSLRAD